MFPGLFAAVYYITSLLSDICGATPSVRAELLIAAPKVLQAVFAALADYFTWRLARKTFGSRGETRVAVCSHLGEYRSISTVVTDTFYAWAIALPHYIKSMAVVLFHSDPVQLP